MAGVCIFLQLVININEVDMYYFDSKTLNFYPQSLVDSYTDIDVSTMQLVDEDTFNKIINGNGQRAADSEGNPILIPCAPSEYHAWNGTEWMLSDEKQAELIKSKRQQLVDNIDSTASELIRKWTRFESEYKEREKAALAFKENQYHGEASIYITGFAVAANVDNQTATNIILQQAEQLRNTLAQMSVLRMRKYELKQDNLTLEQMQAIHDDVVSKMQALAETQK